MTDLEVIEEIDTTVKVLTPKFYKVVLHNDDTTTFEFVIAVLMGVFHHTLDNAVKITEAVHHTGKGIAGGPYSHEIAEEKTNETIAYSRANGFNLTVSFEEM